MNVLLAEDDALLARSACLGLAQRGFVVDWVTSLSGVRRALDEGSHRCLLLDLGLPDGDGLTLLQNLRKEGCTIPVVIITARSEVAMRIRGLELGADDYLTKPYSLDELAARIRAVVRRGEGRASNLLQCGTVSFDPGTGEAKKEGQSVQLSAAEQRLLRYFMENPRQVLSRERLLRALRGDEGEAVASNLLDVHIHHLRRKLGRDTIRTVRGMGYLFTGDDDPA